MSSSDSGAPDAIDAGKCLWCHGSCVSSWHDSSTWQTWHCHMLHHISSVSHYSEHVMRGLKSWGGVRIVNGLSYVIPAQSCLSQRVRDKTNSASFQNVQKCEVNLSFSQDNYSDPFVLPGPSWCLSPTLGQDRLSLGTVNHIFIFNLPALSPARPTKTPAGERNLLIWSIIKITKIY